MKILVVTRSLPFHAFGGMETVAWDLARNLAKKNNEVRVLTTRCEGLPAHSVQDDVDIMCLSVPSGRYSRAWWRESRSLYLEKLQRDTDIVLSISAAAQSMAKGRQSGSPYFVAQAHGTAWNDAVSKMLSTNPVSWLKATVKLKALYDDRAYRYFDCFAAVGETVRTNLTSLPTRWVSGDIPVETIYNGINAEAFCFDGIARQRAREQLGLTPNDKAVISVSRLHVQKGLLESLAAFECAAAKDPSLRYVIVGSGPLEQSLRDMVCSRGLERLVKFLGFVPRDRLPPYLWAADIFLFTTRCVEGLPLNLLESLSAGLPCIVSNHVSNADWGTISVPPNKPDVIANEILKLPVAQIGHRRSRLPKQYTLDVATAKYIELFERLVYDGSK